MSPSLAGLPRGLAEFQRLYFVAWQLGQPLGLLRDLEKGAASPITLQMTLHYLQVAGSRYELVLPVIVGTAH